MSEVIIKCVSGTGPNTETWNITIGTETRFNQHDQPIPGNEITMSVKEAKELVWKLRSLTERLSPETR